MKKVLLLVASGLLACGSPGSSDAGTDAGPSVDAGADAGTSTIAYSGARSATFAAIAPTTAYTPSTNTGELSLLANGATEHTSIDIFFLGVPAMGTYVPNADAGISCTVLVYVPAPSLDGWGANHGNSLPDFGECSLTLTSVALSADHTTQRNYAVHGSVNATLPARSGNATGTVNFAASF